MRRLKLDKAFTLIESGPVVLVTTHDGQKDNIVVLEAVAACIDTARKKKRTVHAVGDGSFIVDGRRLNRRKMMAAKIPPGV
jgi:hypothetical protein